MKKRAITFEKSKTDLEISEISPQDMCQTHLYVCQQIINSGDLLI